MITPTSNKFSQERYIIFCFFNAYIKIFNSFKYFIEGLPEEERDDCVLIFHCAPSDPNGTDLPRLCRHLMPECNVAFTYTINQGQPFHDGLMN